MKGVFPKVKKKNPISNSITHTRLLVKYLKLVTNIIKYFGLHLNQTAINTNLDILKHALIWIVKELGIQLSLTKFMRGNDKQLNKHFNRLRGAQKGGNLHDG